MIVTEWTFSMISWDISQANIHEPHTSRIMEKNVLFANKKKIIKTNEAIVMKFKIVKKFELKIIQKRGPLNKI